MATTTARRRAAAPPARPKKKGVRSIYVDDQLWRLAKIDGASNNKTVSEIIREELRRRYGKQLAQDGQ